MKSYEVKKAEGNPFLDALNYHNQRLAIFLNDLKKSQYQNESCGALDSLEVTIAGLAITLFKEEKRLEEIDSDTAVAFLNVFRCFFISVRDATTPDELDHYINHMKNVLAGLLPNAASYANPTDRLSLLYFSIIASLDTYNTARYEATKVTYKPTPSNNIYGNRNDTAPLLAGPILKDSTFNDFRVDLHVRNCAEKCVRQTLTIRQMPAFENTTANSAANFFMKAIGPGLIALGIGVCFALLPVGIALIVFGVLATRHAYKEHKTSKKRRENFDATAIGFTNDVINRDTTLVLMKMQAIGLSSAFVIAQTGHDPDRLDWQETPTTPKQTSGPLFPAAAPPAPRIAASPFADHKHSLPFM